MSNTSDRTSPHPSRAAILPTQTLWAFTIAPTRPSESSSAAAIAPIRAAIAPTWAAEIMRVPTEVPLTVANAPLKAVNAPLKAVKTLLTAVESVPLTVRGSLARPRIAADEVRSCLRVIECPRIGTVFACGPPHVSVQERLGVAKADLLRKEPGSENQAAPTSMARSSMPPASV